MKLLVCALISKFGDSTYSISMLYGNADSSNYPSEPQGITDEHVLKMACTFSQGITLPKGGIRNSAFFYNSRSAGSYIKATSMELLLGKVTSNNLILACFDEITLNQANYVLNSIKRTTEAPAIHGKFVCTGSISILSSIELT